MSETHPLARYRDSFEPKLTQAQMAEHFGVTQSFWSYLESGKFFARPALAKRIGTATGINPDVLMNLTDSETYRSRGRTRPKRRRFIK